MPVGRADGTPPKFQLQVQHWVEKKTSGEEVESGNIKAYTKAQNHAHPFTFCICYPLAELNNKRIVDK